MNHFNVAVSDPKLAASVADAIDARFANSSHETKTESLREMAQASLQSIGDFDFLIRAVVGAVLAALLFATTTMMIQSVHERTPELAVIKTRRLHRSRRVPAGTRGGSGVFARGRRVRSRGWRRWCCRSRHGSYSGSRCQASWCSIGIVLGTLVALISAAIPAALAARLPVATALAGHRAA